MKKLLTGLAAAALLAAPAIAGSNTFQVSGQGTLNDGRVFNMNARIDKNGNVSGHATLINTGFSGDTGRGPFTAHIKITCVNFANGEIIFGGETTRTNDSNLNDAVFFAVSDDGNKVSRAYFWDGDPTTNGIPGNCIFNNAGDYPLEDIIRGNFTIKRG